MRLIDTNELMKWIKNWQRMDDYYHSGKKRNDIPISELEDIIERMPAIEIGVLQVKGDTNTQTKREPEPLPYNHPHCIEEEYRHLACTYPVCDMSCPVQQDRMKKELERIGIGVKRKEK